MIKVEWKKWNRIGLINAKTELNICDMQYEMDTIERVARLYCVTCRRVMTVLTRQDRWNKTSYKWCMAMNHNSTGWIPPDIRQLGFDGKFKVNCT